MKRIISLIFIAIISFSCGYFLSSYLQTQKKKQGGKFFYKLGVNEYGTNWDMFRPSACNVYINNHETKIYMAKKEEYFYELLKDTVYLDIAAEIKGRKQLIKMEGNYYEILYYQIKRKPYCFDNLFYATPDTVYKVELKPVYIEIDTIRPIRKK
jgi:hypothetical protein